MQLKLETLDYQTQATQAVVKLFNGNIKNTSENANTDGIRFNLLSLNDTQIEVNKLSTIALNGLKIEDAKVSNEPDICIEMETGTGKTLVYIRTIYELNKVYGFCKFVIVVPSVAIREGTLKNLAITAKDMKTKFEDAYKPILDKGVKFYATLGNHDASNQRFYEYFNMKGEEYYRFEKGGVSFYSLN